ncbi:transcriptional regulator, MerR family protein [Clostridium sartagoforme AAU1]|uniref:Transcriptional regulator, MerR family protein n=1 Tax=Clostridium sartagoforme AAU1 TaxID=1202534 RepID=R9C7X8_9CLOT|nr:MerR family DNA-binding transcriptional regulator [Clostridium sartagoforme]EOR25353.1 transcriptional regulator, MerR family protein [Clostridium sartagoforme AAU1]
MQKLLRIGQVSNLYNISLDTLRYYDRKDLLKPIVDKQNGYRYYSLEHLDILEMILIGKYLEIPLEQMKEKIDSESISGYLNMMEEQNQSIEEKLAILTKLSQYTNEMTNMLKHIQNFSNDSTFSKITTEKDLDITIYQINLKNFPNNLENTQINGIEAFDQWISYNVDNNYSIIGNSEILGLSINKNIIHSNELGIYLDTVTKEEKMSKHHISGSYRHISFWGNEYELQEYLHLLCNHFKLKNTSLHIKFCFALLHKDMKHEYFANIYFPE